MRSSPPPATKPALDEQPAARVVKPGAAGPSGLPIVVPLHFVGDTPVIMMTDTNLPGIGTFTVRLLFSGDRYAGTWQHGEVGGQMSGRISPTPVAP